MTESFHCKRFVVARLKLKARGHSVFRTEAMDLGLGEGNRYVVAMAEGTRWSIHSISSLERFVDHGWRPQQ